MTPEQKTAWDMRQAGHSRGEIAKAMGNSPEAVKSLLRRAKKWVDADPAVTEVAGHIGLSDVSRLGHYWDKIELEDGRKISAFIKNDTASLYANDAIDAVIDKFKDLPAVKLPFPVADTVDGKLVFYALADIHLGMRAWGDETGEDYDTDIGVTRVNDGFGDLVNASPPSKEAIIVAIGDSLHANDETAQTPSSKHVLDVDSRHYRVQDMAIEMFAAAVELAAQKHQQVTFCILPGNHDRDAYRAIMFAMRERYRTNSRVTIIASPMEFFVHEFGKCMIACHHGDKAKAVRLVLDAADRWPEMWGRTRYRHYYTGHLHHHKSEDIGGMAWTQLRAITAKDAYASGHSYGAKAQMVSYVFDQDRGEIAQHKVNL